jgi:small subunit ribosomal protein S7
MPRHPYKKRSVKPDAIYSSLEIAKLINYITIDGKKSVASSIVYQSMEELKKENPDPLKVLHKAINNVAPTVEVKPRRLGGASYLVPTEVRKERRLYLALNWIIEAAKAKPNKEFRSFEAKLTSEIVEASKNQGASVSKRLQAEKLAEANKAFAHLKW